MEWDSKTTAKQNLESMLGMAAQLLNISIDEHMEINKKIMFEMEVLKKPWALKQKLSVSNSATMTLARAASDSSLWQNANVEWLVDPKKFQPFFLPKMKIPGNESQGVYNSTKDYFDTIIPLWIGMTFELGNAAVNPKCRSKMNDNECGLVSIYLWKTAFSNCIFFGCS